MKNELILNSKELLACLKKIKPFIPKDGVLSSLECVMFCVTDKHKIKIHATNLESYIVCDIDGKCGTETQYLIPFAQLLSISNSLPNSPMKFIYDDINKNIEIECETAKYSIACGDECDNFPVMPEVGEVHTKRDISLRMTDDLTRAMLFASGDMLHPAMTGIYFDFKNKSLRLVATDAHCLFMSDIYDSPFFDSRSFVVPCGFLKNIIAISKKEFGALAFTDNHVIFSNENTSIVCRLIDAPYPDYYAVIPIHKNHFSVNRNSLIQAIQSLIPVTNRTTSQIILSVNGSLKIEANDIDFACSGIKEIQVINPSNLEYFFSFNAKALLSILMSSKSNNINIYNDGNPTQAFIFKEGDEKTLTLGMPLMIAA